MIIVLRSIAFNLAFYLYNIFTCLMFLPMMLVPRKMAYYALMGYFNGIYWIERIFLGLDYRVEGREHLPADGRYIVAVKHQSAYETLKMQRLFGDIAIILKKELQWIPLWGWYTKKLGMIAVDRGGREKAVRSIVEGSRRVLNEHRPIIIYPQGTRVAVTDTAKQKPYKIGIARMYEAQNVPVVPVAMNAGQFWGRHSFIKYPGVVTFRILPPIMPGLPTMEFLKKLEEVTEAHTLDIMKKHDEELAARKPAAKFGWAGFVSGFLFAALVWTGWWFWLSAHTAQRLDGLKDYAAKAGFNFEATYGPVSGYPFAIKTYMSNILLTDADTAIVIPRVDALAPAWPNTVARISTQNLSVERKLTRQRTLQLDTQQADISIRMPAFWRPREDRAFTIEKLYLKSGETVLMADGAVRLPLHTPYISGTLSISGSHLDDLLPQLVEQNILDRKNARLASGFLRMMSADTAEGVAVKLPLTIDDTGRVKLAGLIGLGELPPLRPLEP